MIGGGVGGCSVLYWLARLGWEDVVLVERAELTSGSTFHSAGLVGQLRSSLSLTKMMMASVDLYRSLEAEVGLETGWREVGSLRLASSEERMEEIARQAGWAKTFGLPLELISPAEAQELFPPMSTDGVLGAAYLPTDGYIDPSQLTFALAEGARRRGAEIEQRTRVTGRSWAPTTLAWGHDNRTCGFRIVGHGQSLRVEARIPGGDVNPYLAFAAIIASGLHGIENELRLPRSLEGNAYESGADRFPSSMRDAITALEGSAMARAAFGDQVVDHYPELRAHRAGALRQDRHGLGAQALLRERVGHLCG